ncbi:MAG: epoxyqueuosine reductase QueH [Christensenellaceae bacterium]|nr:epoxyqueuosine reductase QueH [Christensenellaceae bacterium]
MQKLLVQACCGPCACAPMPINDYCTMFFYNGDNMDTRNEYDARFYTLQTVADTKGIGIVADYYTGPKEFDTCQDCIRYRLRKCAEAVKRNDFDCFTTTLTVSPHKDTVMVNRIGREVAVEYGIPFLEFDLKKNNGFQASVQKSKELGLYRQKYCGCAKSVRQ